jgi:hypothetical protein
LNRTLGEKLKRVEAEIEKAAEVVLSASGTDALSDYNKTIDIKIARNNTVKYVCKLVFEKPFSNL